MNEQHQFLTCFTVSKLVQMTEKSVCVYRDGRGGVDLLTAAGLLQIEGLAVCRQKEVTQTVFRFMVIFLRKFWNHD